jgi:hypothetical protein
VAAILAQMRGDAIGTGCYGFERRTHGIGVLAAARITQGSDVIDIDAEAQRRRRHVGLSHAGVESPF